MANQEHYDLSRKNGRSKKSTRSRVWKRKRTVLKKVHEFGKITNSPVFLLFVLNNRYYSYSTDAPMWPPPLEKVVSRSYTLIATHTLTIGFFSVILSKNSSYPEPVKCTPKDFETG